uniref:Maturase K n=1 Tax=Romanomermis culicivorax TaxID=13658 RepID=A0A915HTS3_ROMCU
MSGVRHEKDKFWCIYEMYFKIYKLIFLPSHDRQSKIQGAKLRRIFYNQKEMRYLKPSFLDIVSRNNIMQHAFLLSSCMSSKRSRSGFFDLNAFKVPDVSLINIMYKIQFQNEANCYHK